MNSIINEPQTAYAQGNETENVISRDIPLTNLDQFKDLDDFSNQSVDNADNQESRSAINDEIPVGDKNHNVDAEPGNKNVEKANGQEVQDRKTESEIETTFNTITEKFCDINPNASSCCNIEKARDCTERIDDQIDTNAEIDLGKITLSNFKTIPEQVKYTEKFRVQVTIENNNDIPLIYRGDECGHSPLWIAFDDYVNVQNLMTCQSISTEILGSHQSVTVEGPTYQKLTALGVGVSEAIVSFSFIPGTDPNQSEMNKVSKFEIQISDINNSPSDSSVEGIPQTQSSENPPLGEGVPQGSAMGEVVLSNFKTIPSTISPGMPFTHEVKVTNNMNAPVFFYNSCSKTGLNYNNTILSHDPGSFCDDLTPYKTKLDQGASAVVYGPGQRNVLVYSTPGEKNIDLSLTYNIGFPQGTEDHTDSKSFKIDVPQT